MGTTTIIMLDTPCETNLVGAPVNWWRLHCILQRKFPGNCTDAWAN